MRESPLRYFFAYTTYLTGGGLLITDTYFTEGEEFLLWRRGANLFHSN